jgi:hypothetical protein
MNLPDRRVLCPLYIPMYSHRYEGDLNIVLKPKTIGAWKGKIGFVLVNDCSQTFRLIASGDYKLDETKGKLKITNSDKGDFTLNFGVKKGLFFIPKCKESQLFISTNKLYHFRGWPFSFWDIENDEEVKVEIDGRKCVNPHIHSQYTSAFWYESCKWVTGKELIERGMMKESDLETINDRGFEHMKWENGKMIKIYML